LIFEINILQGLKVERFIRFVDRLYSSWARAGVLRVVVEVYAIDILN